MHAPHTGKEKYFLCSRSRRLQIEASIGTRMIILASHHRKNLKFSFAIYLAAGFPRREVAAKARLKATKDLIDLGIKME